MRRFLDQVTLKICYEANRAVGHYGIVKAVNKSKPKIKLIEKVRCSAKTLIEKEAGFQAQIQHIVSFRTGST